MKKVLLFIGVVLAMTACKKDQATQTAATPSADKPSGTVDVAYVNVDSVMNVYQYAKDLSAKFESAGKSKESELQVKAEKFQRRAADFQSKVQQHLITSAQAEKLGQELEQERQSLGLLQQKMQQDLSFQERETLLILNDRLTAVLKDLNKDQKYKMILRNSVVMGNVLNAVPEADITTRVIELLNARYKTAQESKK